MKIDKSWTLFLDRDGVINSEFGTEYVKHWGEFKFEPGALQALSILATIFGRIVIVTNQRGVGTGLMTEGDLHFIHERMRENIEKNNGRIDAIYYCADDDRTSPHRKPHPYMGLLAREKFPDINFQKSVMVGNSLSDMQFGIGLGMQAVFIDDKKALKGVKLEEMDLLFESLLEYAEFLQQSI